MRRIESRIDTNSSDFKANHAAMSERLKEFHARQHATRFERPQRDIDRLSEAEQAGGTRAAEAAARSRHAVSGIFDAGRLPRI
jgi:hypothetical protein